MILCLDIGNSQLLGGVFEENKLLARFRHDSRSSSSSDQIGVFLKAVLRENDIDTHQIRHIAICSVVPGMDYSIRAACHKYFSLEPFILTPASNTGLQIQYRHPPELGSDRIANAIAAMDLYPKKNLIVADFGTATTFCVITANKEYKGGVILAGMRLSMEALKNNAAKLFPVEILRPTSILGKTTAESIQSGLYYGQLATLKEITARITREVFAGEKPIIIGTGGFAHLFEKEGIFEMNTPDLVLHGLRIALKMNLG